MMFDDTDSETQDTHTESAMETSQASGGRRSVVVSCGSVTSQVLMLVCAVSKVGLYYLK